MRIITQKLHRAFPELDRFDDAHAAAFVHVAATNSARWRFVQAIVVTVVGVAILIATGAILGLLTAALPIPRDSLLVPALVIIATLFVSFTSSYITRDLLLKRRIAGILASQARCAECQYVLLGLKRDAEGRVTCPECGRAAVVDASFDALAADTTGQAQLEAFVAVESQLQAERRQHRRRQLSTIFRRGLPWVAVITFLACGAFLLRWWLNEAARAAEMRDAQAQLQSLLLNTPVPSRTPQDEARLSALRAVGEQVSRAIKRESTPTQPSISQLGTELIWLDRGASSAYNTETRSEAFATSQLVFNAWQTPDGGESAINAAARLAIGGPINLLNLHARLDVSDGVFAIADLAALAIIRAGETRDHRLFEQALDIAAFAINTLNTHDSAATAANTRYWQAQILGWGMTVAANADDNTWLTTYEQRLLNALQPRDYVKTVDQIEAQQLIAVAQVYADPERVTLKHWQADADRTFNPGTFAANTASIRQQATNARARIQQSPSQWTQTVQSWRLSVITAELPALSRTAISNFANFTEYAVLDKLLVDAARLQVHLERHRIANGSYPAKLAELGLSQVTVDPYTSQPLLYHASVNGQRDYWLWSLSVNRVDDHASGNSPLGPLYTRGLDEVFFSPPRSKTWLKPPQIPPDQP